MKFLAAARLRPPLCGLKAIVLGTCSTIRVKNHRYFKPFDNTDNPCCWQVGAVCDDIEQVLESQGISFDVLSEDWGTSYWWVDANGVEHSVQVSCTDVESVTFTIEYFATRRAWMLFRRIVDNSETDFVKLVPELKALNDGTPADARSESAT